MCSIYSVSIFCYPRYSFIMQLISFSTCIDDLIDFIYIYCPKDYLTPNIFVHLVWFVEVREIFPPAKIFSTL